MTIYDIARIAGVSPGTVSRVVNHKPGVKKSTRQRIEALLKEHHYTPDMNARSLVMQSSRMVGVLTDDLITTRLGSVLFGVLQELMRNGYFCFVQHVDESHPMEQGMMELASHRVVGALLLGVTFTQQEKVSAALAQHLSDVPVVMVNQSTDFGMKNVYSVGVNEYEAFQRCVTLLAQRGRRNMALLIDRDRVSRGIIRKGFEDGIRANGISGRVYEDVPVSVASGEEKGMHILRKHPEVDAILCAQDLLAVGVLNAAHDAGRSIPEDIAVMGEDNSILCQATRPQLSSLDTIIPAVAIASARALMDTLSGRPVVHRMILDMELVERGTT